MILRSRRDFLKTAALVAHGALMFPSIAAYAFDPNLGVPNFSPNNILRQVAGLRPLRSSGVRLEIENVLSKRIVHNYGHGGSGFTLAWGSAAEAADLVGQSQTQCTSVAVLGGGVIGLTTALVLAERGYKVTVYTSKLSPETTSDLAGAQWSPSFVSTGATPAEKQRYERMLAVSYQRYETLAGSKYGVYLRDNYIADGYHDGVQDVPAGILRPSRTIQRLPFAGMRKGGTLIQSWLIEPPVFLPALMAELRARGVQFVRSEWQSAQQLAALAESTIVNCLGLGSKKLFADADLIPTKGQLIWLKPDPRLQYIILHRGYIFCRSDAIVLGGSYEKNNYDLHIDSNVSAHILEINRNFFS